MEAPTRDPSSHVDPSPQFQVYYTEVNSRTEGATHEQKGKRFCLILPANTRRCLAVPITSDKGKDKRHPTLAYGIPLTKGEVCCIKESHLLPLKIAPLPLRGSVPITLCDSTSKPPEFSSRLRPALLVRFKMVLKPDDLSKTPDTEQCRLAFFTFHGRTPGKTPCCILSNHEFNSRRGGWVVVPLGEKYERIWDGLQHVDGTVEWSKDAEQRPVRLPLTFLAEAWQVLRLVPSSPH